MAFKDLQNIHLNYYSLSDDIAENFYIPCLKEARIYKRAVGFFSSNILLQISKGLGAFADHNGRMQLIVSTRLDKEDYDAIKEGYDEKDKLKDKVIDEFDFDIDYPQKEARFKLLAHMIATGMLEIKVAALKSNNNTAMYHEKLGIMEDEKGDKIVFTGSGNETFNAYNTNYESFDVYSSWLSDESEARCEIKELNFNRIWNNAEPNLVVIDFPEIIKNKLLKYDNASSTERFATIDEDFIERLNEDKLKPRYPKMGNIKLRDYQNRAIDNWELHNFRGIFDMATGTGKTFTGAGALIRLFEKKQRLVAIICAPFTHLVDQWCDELKNFNIDAIKCYGSQDYEKKLQRQLTKFHQKRTDFVCAVVCNASFQKEKFQQMIQLNLKHTLLLVDEAHNFGANNTSKCLEVDYPYRLALSATLDRHNDIEGTKKLFNFFGEKCIEYDLARAIKEDKLTPYYYFPVVVSFDDEEYDQYMDLSQKIGKARAQCKDGELSEHAKMLLIKRARIVASAKEKIYRLRGILENYKDEHNMLIYCGAVTYGESGYDVALEEKRQIQIIWEMLNKELHIYASKFTSEEDTETRKGILEAFKSNSTQALVAIKCLDEGMNIPSIKTAFILASSTNPKEYIQRRGRVLRKAPNKISAKIYDFIVLPRKMIGNNDLYSYAAPIEKNLVRKELERLKNFAILSKNPFDSTSLIEKINSYFGLDIITDEEGLYE